MSDEAETKAAQDSMLAMSAPVADNPLFKFYDDAYRWVIKNGYETEVKWAESLRFDKVTADDFLDEYLWTVVTTGLAIRVAKPLYQRFRSSGNDLSLIKHTAKRKAITEGLANYDHWFERIKAIKDRRQLIDYLDGFPFVGSVTKYQLAQNIGIPVAKPDIWLTRVAKRFGETDVQTMCAKIADKKGQKIRTVDYVIWRYCEQGNLRVKSKPDSSPTGEAP